MFFGKSEVLRLIFPDFKAEGLSQQSKYAVTDQVELLGCAVKIFESEWSKKKKTKKTYSLWDEPTFLSFLLLANYFESQTIWLSYVLFF